jgi:hypothetical protein
MVSALPMNRVAECIGANNVVIKRWRKNVTQQQFYFDNVSKTIRSQTWKNYGMQIQSNGGSANLRFSSTINSRWWELFRFQEGKFIVNDKGKVMDVSGGLDNEN